MSAPAIEAKLLRLDLLLDEGLDTRLIDKIAPPPQVAYVSRRPFAFKLTDSVIDEGEGVYAFTQNLHPELQDRRTAAEDRQIFKTDFEAVLRDMAHKEEYEEERLRILAETEAENLKQQKAWEEEQAMLAEQEAARL